MDFLKKTIKLKNSDTKPGVFNKADYPEEYQGKNFYFYEYCKPDGELINKDDPICKIRVGEKSGYFFNSLTVIAQEDGILEWTLRKDNLINNDYTIYKLHPKGTYKGENSTEKHEYKHLFKRQNKKCSLDKWLVEDGMKVQVGENIYEYNISGEGQYFHQAEKDGYIHIVGANTIYSIKDSELLYYIRETDEQRLRERNENIEIEKDAQTKEDFCFVYLMHDTANDFYKIGISNKPHYRERTLQSEKPTIELITSKKFPVRKIAESIEKSLHQVYSEKRLRGEWFELNKKDVENILDTLK